ncbi:hypothetical protein Dvina_17235 [Dactylosporangium vinaceum]|uniref:Uncharacterized protein n=1 Tax=Dactylosporangium vinaceum TaxID=53362 RepID=A0ABV5MK79_9ACTN|nr:hypothetical protein [Dactylosporangium vinaceum]UAB99655.1 hypothetical protein Dvina_17235 [Dactylosporangium vinaceum]
MGEMLMTPIAGGTLVLALDDTRTGGVPLAAWMREQRVEIVTLNQSVLAVRATRGDPGPRPGQHRPPAHISRPRR